MEVLGGVAAQVTVLLAAATAVGAALRWTWRAGRTLVRLADELLGDGTGDRPGVVVRLAAIEQELRPNHGSSLRDAVDRVERRLDEHLDEHRRTKV